jgi:hypothetical protein
MRHIILDIVRVIFILFTVLGGIGVIVFALFLLWLLGLFVKNATIGCVKKIIRRTRDAWFYALYGRNEDIIRKLICPRCGQSIHQTGQYSYADKWITIHEEHGLPGHMSRGMGDTTGYSYYVETSVTALYTIKVLFCNPCHRRWKLRDVIYSYQ